MSQLVDVTTSVVDAGGIGGPQSPLQISVKGPELSQLGQQPLGEWLFAHPELQRGALEYADLAASAFWRAAMAALGQPVGHALWARRCRWQLDNGSLSVMELFLPAAPLYAGTEEQSEQE